MSVHEQGQLKCQHCDYKFSRKESLCVHIKSVHKQIKFECNKCDYKSSGRVHLHFHIQSIHDQIQSSMKDFFKSKISRRQLRI